MRWDSLYSPTASKRPQRPESTKDAPAPLSVVLSGHIGAALAGGAKPETVFDELVLAVATFVAGAAGSPVDHRALAEAFHACVMNEMPKARHRLAALAQKQENEG